jgi:putative DNA primase/helicase
MPTIEQLGRWIQRQNGAADERRSGPTLSPSVPPIARPRRSLLDLEAFDIVAFFQAHEAYGHLISDEQGKHTVLCPWEEEHSSGTGADDTDTVIWDGRDGRLPGFKCQHSHCVNRRIQEVLAIWTDAENFGARLRQTTDYSLTDNGNVQRVIDLYHDHLRYCKELGGWFVWQGEGRWEQTAESSGVYEMVRDVIRRMNAEGEQIGDGERREKMRKHVVTTQKWERMRAIVNMSQTRRDVIAKSYQFDERADLLNCPNGTINLKTGEVHDNRPEHYLTKQVPVLYNPEATCPQFDQFMTDIFAGNPELIDYVWRAIGYSLTGHINEQVLFFCYGNGANGKSTLFDVLQKLLGDYAACAAPNLVVETKGDRHPTEIADLRGRRFVYCMETGENKYLAEDLVKRLTGGDIIKARFMHQNFFSFVPTHKLWLSANHKPVIRGTDFAIWRRIPLIPFTVKFVDEALAQPGDRLKDRELPVKLAQELPGILTKAVRAAAEWYRIGLNWPACVRAAVDEYREEQDVIGTFLEERCEMGPDLWEPAHSLYTAYNDWATQANEYRLSSRKFGTAMLERGFRKSKVSTVRYHGLRVIPATERVGREDYDLSRI